MIAAQVDESLAPWRAAYDEPAYLLPLVHRGCRWAADSQEVPIAVVLSSRLY